MQGIKEHQREHQVLLQLHKDYGNVAYNDFVKVVLSEGEFQAIFGPQEPIAERVGDLMKFWMGCFELAESTPAMFEEWGGLKKLLIFYHSSKPSVTVNRRRNSAKKSDMMGEEALRVQWLMNNFQPVSEEDLGRKVVHKALMG